MWWLGEADKVRESAERSRRELLKLPNVVGVGVGLKEVSGIQTGELAVAVLVESKVPAAQLAQNEAVPRLVDGFPTDVIEVGQLRALDELRDLDERRALGPGRSKSSARQSGPRRSGPRRSGPHQSSPRQPKPLRPEDHRRYLRPACPGTSIGHYIVSAGTFGALVWDQRTGDPLILSNNHVLANSTNGRDGRARKGDLVLQPGPHDAALARYDDLTTSNLSAAMSSPASAALQEVAAGRAALAAEAAGAPKAQVVNAQLLNFRLARLERYVPFRTRKSNRVDCAVARPLDPDLVRGEILGLGPVKGTAEARLGAVVRKSGRTTGVTQARVRTMHVSLRIMYPQGFLAFEDQIVCGYMSEGGDSGALVLDEENRAIGLLFAGSDKATILNPIEAVTAALKVSLK